MVIFMTYILRQGSSYFPTGLDRFASELPDFHTLLLLHLDGAREDGP